jgi:hypothetical protein
MSCNRIQTARVAATPGTGETTPGFRFLSAAIAVLLSAGISISQAFAGTKDIKPATAGSPDQWQLSGGASKVQAVTDANDNTFIYEDTDGQIQDFTLTDPTGINESDTIDSVNVIWRAQDNGNGTNEARVNLYLSGNTGNGPTVGLATSWADYEHSFADKPGGSGWTIGDVNGLEVQTECVAVAKNRTVACASLFVTVYYTPAAVNVSPRRKKIKTEFGG